MESVSRSLPFPDWQRQVRGNILKTNIADSISNPGITTSNSVTESKRCASPPGTFQRITLTDAIHLLQAGRANCLFI